MKHLILFSLIIATIMFFFGCSENNAVDPQLSQNDQLPTSLAKKVYTYFNGTETLIAFLDPGKTVTLPSGRVLIRGLVVETQDIMNDPRVTGMPVWIVNMDVYPDGSDKRWGSGELDIPNMGNWDMTFVGWNSLENGVTYEVEGHGKNEFSGLKAHWTYRKPIGDPDFTVHGYIIENN